MKLILRYTSLVGFLLCAHFCSAQVVFTEPEFPTQKDDITLFFDASKGNGALKGFTGTVYAHTGVITSQSANDNDWQHVIGNWGTDDERVKMKREGDDLYSLSYNIETFHGVPVGEMVRQLAFVFRNQDGSIVARDTDGSDIFLDVFSDDSGLLAELIEPTEDLIVYVGESFPIVLSINQEADVEITLDQETIFQQVTSEVSTSYTINQQGPSLLSINIETENESVLIERNVLAINREIERVNPNEAFKTGLNIFLPIDRLVFRLDAPDKEHVFLLCPANNFKPHLDYRMTPNEGGNTFWIRLSTDSFPPGENYYQYLVDGEIIIADPLSTTILDPANDSQINENWSSMYPDNARGHVSVVNIWDESYVWRNNLFEVPATEDLIIYELMMRDFNEDQQFTTLIDTLDYLERLGINAIELMPVQEFEGNESWGYNPSYHMALDKALGTRNEFKKLVDECHNRGIAVILDVVYNHSFSQSPLCQLYWDPINFQPSADNPWLNTTARHPFNVGYDFNHQSPYTRQWVKRVVEYWIEEFRVDGFRFDLSKGFTQTNTVGDPDRMAKFDESRINVLTDYAEHIWSLDSDNIVILEHFAELREEKELASRGMLLWNNNQWQFAEAAMGYRSDLSGADYTERGMETPSLVTYLESHDEERMAHKIKQYGNSDGDYNTQELETLTERMVAAYTIFMSVPGPKMVWQFSELAYDESINRCVSGSVNDNCRLDPKPIRWSYQDNEHRQDLYQKLSALFQFKKNTSTFNTTDFTLDDSDPYLKSVTLSDDLMDIVSVANFDVKSREVDISFPQIGTWYEFYTSQPYEVEQTRQTISLNPGGYKIFTSAPTDYSGQFTTSVNEAVELELVVYPNPIKNGSELLLSQSVDRVQIFDITGKKVFDKKAKRSSVNISGLSPSLYVVKTFKEDLVSSHKIVIQ